MRAYRLTPAADADLDELWQYIALQSGTTAADRLEAELHDAMLRLAQAPGIGHAREDLADETLRCHPVHRYLVVYRPATDPIQIVRVLHGARDVEAIFRSALPD
jgi:plasmid stabilization system protein ParE